MTRTFTEFFVKEGSQRRPQKIHEDVVYVRFPARHETLMEFVSDPVKGPKKHRESLGWNAAPPRDEAPH